METFLDLSYWWLIAAVILVILEVCTASFGVICFAIGALLAALAAFLDAPLSLQIGIFSVGSMLALLFLRPVMLRIFSGRDNHKSNVDALIGRKAVVCEAIDAAAGTGRVKVDGDEWKAVSASGEVLTVGTSVEIVSRDSIILTVK